MLAPSHALATLLLALTLSGTAVASANPPDPAISEPAGGSRRNATSTSRAEASTWVSIGAFVQATPSGLAEEGALLTVSIAFDRIARGPVHRVRDLPPLVVDLPPSPNTAADSMPGRARKRPDPLSPRVARLAVKAAWRASGLGTDDSRIDAIIARSRASASLPELRLRAMRVLTDAAKQDTTTAASDGLYYQTLGSGLTLEARMTWRLDRLLYADDEPTMERVRLERFDARQKLAARVLEALFQWQRATFDVEGAANDSREKRDAEVHVSELASMLDVLTAGWFTAFSNERGLLHHEAESAVLPKSDDSAGHDRD